MNTENQITQEQNPSIILLLSDGQITFPKILLPLSDFLKLIYHNDQNLTLQIKKVRIKSMEICISFLLNHYNQKKEKFDSFYKFETPYCIEGPLNMPFIPKDKQLFRNLFCEIGKSEQQKQDNVRVFLELIEIGDYLNIKPLRQIVYVILNAWVMQNQNIINYMNF